MRKRTLVLHSVSHRSALALLLLLVFAAPPSLAQDREVTVRVGQTKCLSIRRQVTRHDVRANPADIVNARFDTNQNRLCFKGNRQGTAQVTFKGSYRRIDVGREIHDRNLDFTHQVNVTVLPPNTDVREIPTTFVIRRGQTRRMQLSVLMGPAFSRKEDENVRWRNVSANVSGNAAEVWTGDRRGRMMVEMSGTVRGNARVEFRGERRYQGGWIQVVRTARLRVE